MRTVGLGDGFSLFCSDCHGEATMTNDEFRELRLLGKSPEGIILDRFKYATRNMLARKVVT